LVKVRLATKADEQSVLRLLRKYCDEVGTPLTDEHLLKGLAPLLEENEHGVVLVAEKSEIIGYSILTWGWGIESGGKEALVDEMFVIESERAGGVGTALMQASIDYARKQEVQVIFLETEENNPRSRSLYQKLGFEEETSIWMSCRL